MARVGTYVSEEGLTAQVTIWPAYLSNGPTFGCHDADFWVAEEVEIEPKDSPLRQEILERHRDEELDLV